MFETFELKAGMLAVRNDDPHPRLLFDPSRLEIKYRERHPTVDGHMTPQ